jgi:UDP-GlcNAc:undecaprenyl-phosphate GlcNAc-1-phosphate transferase
VLVGILSSLFAFLYYNWHPSKMYMGDTGSQFLGVFLAYMGITYFWNDAYQTGEVVPSKQIMIVLLAFILPIIDTTVVVVKRLSKKQSPFVGGKDHTTHSLAYIGLSDRSVAMVFAAISFLSLCLIYIINTYLNHWTHFYTALFSIYFLLLLAFFFYISWDKKNAA